MTYHTYLVDTTLQRLYGYGVGCSHSSVVDLHRHVTHLPYVIFLLDCLDLVHGAGKLPCLTASPIPRQFQWLSDDFESRRPSLTHRLNHIKRYIAELRCIVESTCRPTPLSFKLEFHLNAPTLDLMISHIGEDEALKRLARFRPYHHIKYNKKC